MASYRQLAAIMFADIQGFTGFMHRDEALANSFRRRLVDASEKYIVAHDGKIVKIEGDGVLCYFNSAVNAVRAAIDIQAAMKQKPEIPLRIGIHLGDVMHDDNSIYGDAVNIASRLETFALPGSILISQKVNEELLNQTDIQVHSLGRFVVKSIINPINVYAVANEGLRIPFRHELHGKGKPYNPVSDFARRSGLFIWAPILAIAALAYFFLVHNKVDAEEKSIAVLPFQASGMDSANMYVVDGLSEDLLTEVSRIRGISVISNATMRSYKDTRLPPNEICRQLNVTNLLMGSVKLKDNRIRIFTELIDAASGKSLWANTFEEQFSNIFSMQDKIVEQVALVLKAKLSNEEKNLIHKLPTSNTDAYTLYLKGRNRYYQYQNDDNDTAIALFRQAIHIDTAYANAYAALADAYAQKAFTFSGGAQWFDSSEWAGLKSVALDTGLVEGYKALASVYYYRGNTEKAFVPLEKAISLNANYAPAIGNLGTLYFVTGNFSKALHLQQKSAELNPRSAVPPQIIGWIYRLYGMYPQAETWLLKSLAQAPMIDTYRELAYTYLLSGKQGDANRLIADMLATDSSNPNAYTVGAFVAKATGENLRAEILAEKAMTLIGNPANDPTNMTALLQASLMMEKGQKEAGEALLSQVYDLQKSILDSGSEDADPCLAIAGCMALQGKKQEAVDWLQKAVDRKWTDHGVAGMAPWLNSLHDFAPYKALMSRMEAQMKAEAKQL